MKILTELNRINANKSITEMISKTFIPQFCEFFNNQYGKLGYVFTDELDEGYPFIVVEKGTDELAQIEICVMDDSSELGLGLWPGYGNKFMKARTLSEMCDLLDTYFISYPWK